MKEFPDIYSRISNPIPTAYLSDKNILSQNYLIENHVSWILKYSRDPFRNILSIPGGTNPEKLNSQPILNKFGTTH